jgi:hypothetical protein
MNGLAAVTAAHNGTWRLDKASWSVNQDAGTIVFAAPNGVRAQAPVQIIGSYDAQDGSWMWAWDNSSIRAPLVEHAGQVRAYGQQHGFARLTTPSFQCTEESCWELVALAFLLCKANGAYRGPAGVGRVFMTFGELTLGKA